ncbi:MAG: HD-GYP domain-containing protein [Candidatus Dormibacteria bacterium]
MSTRSAARDGLVDRLPAAARRVTLTVPDVKRSQPGPTFRPEWRVLAVVAGTTLLAAAVGALWIRPNVSWSTLALAAALVGLLEVRVGVHLRLGRGVVNFSAKAYASIGAVYLLGLPAAAAASLAALVVRLLTHRGDYVKTLFNASMSLLVYASAYGVFQVLRSWPQKNVLLLIVAGAGGGLAAWLVNHLLLGVVLTAEQGARHVQLAAFAKRSTVLSLYYLGYGLTGVGVLAASMWIGAPAALVTLAAPVAIVQTATNRLMREQQARLSEAKTGFDATLISLSKAIDLRDKDTEGHCRRVVEYSLLMGRFLKFSDDDLLRLCHGALLHDIGKIGVPDAILHKDGPLTEEEWAVMRTHPKLGALMVADVQQLEKAREIILNHHERVDGKGYPHGLRGHQIPLAARVFMIADAFDAMISDRPYRTAMSLAGAREEVRRCSGTQFDPECVVAFESIADEELEQVGQKKEQPSAELLSSLDAKQSG